MHKNTEYALALKQKLNKNIKLLQTVRKYSIIDI